MLVTGVQTCALPICVDILLRLIVHMVMVGVDILLRLICCFIAINYHMHDWCVLCSTYHAYDTRYMHAYIIWCWQHGGICLLVRCVLSQ